MKWLPVYRSFWDLSSVVCIYWKLCYPSWQIIYFCCWILLTAFFSHPFHLYQDQQFTSPCYFHGGKRTRTKAWKETWLVNFHHQLHQCKIAVYDFLSYFFTCLNSCPTFFTCMCFSLTLLPTMHIFCSINHLLQTLALYKFWLDSSPLTTQEKKFQHQTHSEHTHNLEMDFPKFILDIWK